MSLRCVPQLSLPAEITPAAPVSSWRTSQENMQAQQSVEGTGRKSTWQAPSAHPGPCSVLDTCSLFYDNTGSAQGLHSHYPSGKMKMQKINLPQSPMDYVAGLQFQPCFGNSVISKGRSSQYHLLLHMPTTTDSCLPCTSVECLLCAGARNPAMSKGHP